MSDNEIDADFVFIAAADGSQLPLYIARPKDFARPSSKHSPCLLLLHEAFGLTAHIRDVAQHFAREGYLVVAPELFHRSAAHGFAGSYDNFNEVMEHLVAVTDDTLNADLQASYQWLQHDDQADTTRIAAIGYCMGGRVVFFANTVLPLRAAIAYYGSGIDPSLAPQQRAPLLLIWGGLDQFIALEQRRAVGDALRTANKNFVEVEYSQADHGFFCDQRASFNAAAARESWALSLAFLRQRMS